MPTVQGKTKPVGTESGAKKYMAQYLTDGKVNMALFGKSGSTFTDRSVNGLYAITLTPPVDYTTGGTGKGVGGLSFGGHTLRFAFDSNGSISNMTLDKKPGKSFLDSLIGGVVGDPSTSSKSQYDRVQAIGKGGNAAINTVESVPQFLAKISSPALWQRIGIGAIGVFILVVAIVLWIAPEAIKTISKVAP